MNNTRRNIYVTATLLALSGSELANATINDSYIEHTIPTSYINYTLDNIDIPAPNKEILLIQKFYNRYDGVFSYNFLSYIDELLHQENIKHKVSLPLIMALMKVESQFDHHSTSSVGAYGLCQLMPLTTKNINVLYRKGKRQLDRMNDYDNVHLCIIYLKDLFMRYKKTENVLRFYNGGIAWRKKPATKAYYNAIMKEKNRLRAFIQGS